ncbi:23S rRNA (adenine(1618)-N(6))-methyltransferase RlmF [Rheinheimera sp. MMS21-TC3]|uniref:23S rRNA (adenine(1618)-N(6))-methyltransferase RlmF n=1 Tax=Rheinheimera sp. MMS21-TC3 TaxID=3072790 RepID=UPI0028C3C09C|nr:23S rRNA (adenine(1618)-N(6))-methyltransferase RlmF [Rheinheimera sp. MMS21-TC3]WNO60461.1 23S rRNA (adenine(1618)-N(6))-methyltransferase RlmF [Rheinheimera sp. MMS21-TC3]
MSIKPSLLHPNNPHQGRYDLTLLCQKYPALTSFIQISPAGLKTINFSNPQAVQSLNAALLASYYQVNFWQLPEEYLCPPIPGRADYLHYAADLVSELPAVSHQTKSSIKMLDIGCGANCIYPILASRSFGWQVIGSDIDAKALQVAQTIINANKNLQQKITLRQQKQSQHIFQGIIQPNEYFSLTVCNPPFYGSAKEATAVNKQKWQKLGKPNQGRNFKGSASELWCEGGELNFISNMIAESYLFSKQVGWFTTLVSQRQHHKPLLALLAKYNKVVIKQQKMQQGQKTSLLLAWRFTD